MKRLFIACAMTMMIFAASAQNVTNYPATDEKTSEVARYKLYATNNMWTFLKLDTRNGRIWQGQGSFESDKRYESVLSSTNLSRGENEVNGRFVLHPTTNNFNFIMLDRVKGDTYQVQWSQEPEKRIIVPIE